MIRPVRIGAAWRVCLGFLVAFAAAAPIGGTPGGAQELVAAGGTPTPKPARGQGEACVAETGWMRRNHMTALSHQRDSTVHAGIRTKRFSLKGCIECHAVTGADGAPVTVASPEHFCRTCHDYVAVRVDCFECHASRPETKASAENPPGNGWAAFTQYPKSVRR